MSPKKNAYGLKISKKFFKKVPFDKFQGPLVMWPSRVACFRLRSIDRQFLQSPHCQQLTAVGRKKQLGAGSSSSLIDRAPRAAQIRAQFRSDSRFLASLGPLFKKGIKLEKIEKNYIRIDLKLKITVVAR